MPIVKVVLKLVEECIVEIAEFLRVVAPAFRDVFRDFHFKAGEVQAGVWQVCSPYD